MENKIKFILFILIAIIGASLFIAFQNYTAKDALTKERDKLIEEKASLDSQIGKLEGALRVNEDKVNSLNRELDRVSREKEAIQRQYDLGKKSYDELAERLKSQRAPALTKPQLESLPTTTDAYWAEILRAKTDLELQLGNIRNELKSAQINNGQLQREKSTLELDINNLKRDNEDLKRQFEYNQKLMDSISQELVREKNDKIQIQNNFKLIKNENAVLTRQLKSINSRKVEFEKELGQLQEDKNSLERRLVDMETMLNDKLSKINYLKQQLDDFLGGRQVETKPGQEESVELPPIVVRPQTETLTSETPVSLVGKVLAVKRDNNFVIINLGEDLGIKAGEAFQVYREDKVIADIEVIKTRKTISACDIKKETTPIAVGDTVR